MKILETTYFEFGNLGYFTVKQKKSRCNSRELYVLLLYCSLYSQDRRLFYDGQRRTSEFGAAGENQFRTTDRLAKQRGQNFRAV